MSRIIPDSVATPQDLPGRVDVVIIGGGIVGTSTALFLAERGISVALCEKGLIGAEQSARNWGWVRQQGRGDQYDGACRADAGGAAVVTVPARSGLHSARGAPGSTSP